MYNSLTKWLLRFWLAIVILSVYFIVIMQLIPKGKGILIAGCLIIIHSIGKKLIITICEKDKDKSIGGE